MRLGIAVRTLGAVCLLSSLASIAVAQANRGELRLHVTDPAGLGLRATVQLTSGANEYRNTLATNDQGLLDVQRLPYGIYQVQIQASAFALMSDSVEIRSALPLERTFRLKVASVSESLNVSAAATLIDPYRPGSVNQLGSQEIQDRLTALPGRGMQDLVNSQPDGSTKAMRFSIPADRNIRRNLLSMASRSPTTVRQALAPSLPMPMTSNP